MAGDSIDLIQIGSIQLPGGVEAAKLVVDPKMLLDVVSGQAADVTKVLPTSHLDTGTPAKNIRDAVRHLRDVGSPPCQTLAIQVANSASYQDSGQDIGVARLLGIIFANADGTTASTLAVTGGDQNGSDQKPRALVRLGANASIAVMFPGSGVDLGVDGLSADGLEAAPVALTASRRGSRIWVLNTGASTAYITLLLSGRSA